MTTGFICKQFSVVGAPEGDTNLEKCEFMLNGVVQALCDTGVWSLDGDLISWGTDSHPEIGRVLVNSNGTRLWVGYCHTSCTYHNLNRLGVTTAATGATAKGVCFAPAGLNMSITPAGTSYGTDPTAQDFLPMDAVRFYGTAGTVTTTTGASYAYSGTASTAIKYSVICKDDVVFLIRSNSTFEKPTAISGFAIGKLFKETAHPDVDGGLWGGFMFAPPNGSESGSNHYTTASSSSNSRVLYECATYGVNDFTASTVYFFTDDLSGTTPSSLTLISSHMYATFTRTGYDSDRLRHWVDCLSKYSHSYVGAPNGPIKQHFSNPHYGSTARWVPLFMAVMFWSEAEPGVVNSDGFKGWVDSDIVRCTCSQGFGRGTVMNDGFLHIGAGLLIAWDPVANAGLSIY